MEPLDSVGIAINISTTETGDEMLEREFSEFFFESEGIDLILEDDDDD